MTKNKSLKIGIIGTGAIAQTIVSSLQCEASCEITAILSRHIDTAKKFSQSYKLNAKCFDNLSQLIEYYHNTKNIDVVYITPPTAKRYLYTEQLAKNNIPIICEKPYISARQIEDIITNSKAPHPFFDATHFVHNIRSQTIQKKILNHDIGQLQHIDASFFFPFSDTQSTRFDKNLEPMGAFGDLGWYPIRAFTYFIPSHSPLRSCDVRMRRDNKTDVIIGGSGYLSFDSGPDLTFRFGYDVGCVEQNIKLCGTKSILYIDDFVIPWQNSFIYNDPHKTHEFSVANGYQPYISQKNHLINNDPPQHVRLFLYVRDVLLGQKYSISSQKLTDETILTAKILAHAFQSATIKE